MSYMQSTLRCEKCRLEMNVAFGVVGNTLIAQWPEKCPECGGTKLLKIADGWKANE